MIKVLWLSLLAMGLAAAPSVPAEPVLLVDGNALLAVDPENSRGAYLFKVDGIEQIKQQWFWYRIGNTGPERSIDTLPLVERIVQGMNQLTLVYQTNAFRLSVTYRLNGSTPGLGISRVSLTELLTVQNIGLTPLNFRVFWYSDLDLGGRPADNLASGGGNVVLQRSPLVDPGRETVVGRFPQRWQIGLGSALLDSLNDGTPTVLSNGDSPVGPGDVSAAFEWGLTLAVTNQASTVAVPITTILSAPCQNEPPTLDPIADLVLEGTASPRTVPLTGITSGSLVETQALLVTATSSHPGLIADPVVNHAFLSSTGSLTLAPLINTNGSATITVTVDDLGCTNNATSQVFNVTVRQINQPPVVSILSPTNGATFLAPARFTVLAEASDPDGWVTNVLFLAGAEGLGQAANPPYFVVWSNVLAGSYDLTARATDNLGAAATSAVVRITVLTNPEPLLASIGPLVLNRQTGLFEQQVRVDFAGAFPLAAVRLALSNALPLGVRLWNATGTEQGRPFVQHNLPLLPGSSLDFQLEYYLTNRLLVETLTNEAGVFNPGYFARGVSAAPPLDPPGDVLSLDRPARVLTNGHFLVEFSTDANRFYYVQYASSVTNAAWKTVVPAIPGNGSRVQWIDAGPPKTESPPATVPSRFYRIVLLP